MSMIWKSKSSEQWSDLKSFPKPFFLESSMFSVGELFDEQKRNSCIFMH